MSRASAQHRKPSRSSSKRPRATARSQPPGTITRHRKPKPSLIASALQHRPARFAAAAVAGSALIVSAAWQTAPHAPGETPHPAPAGSADAPHLAGAGAQHRQLNGTGPLTTRGPAGFARFRATAHARSAPAIHAIQRRKPTQAPHQAPAPPVYRNPLRGVSGLMAERVDMGADFAGSGPVYAIGDAVITNATGNSGGWPGGGWITYRLTDGPAAGLMVYVAEDVTPTVQVGQHVSSATVVASMYAGGDGIETGWAMPDGASAESELPAAGGISGAGPFPTMIGLNFEALLQSLGVPAGNNSTQPGNGVLPANYPSWG